jgi:hypothetical protein
MVLINTFIGICVFLYMASRTNLADGALYWISFVRFSQLYVYEKHLTNSGFNIQYIIILETVECLFALAASVSSILSDGSFIAIHDSKVVLLVRRALVPKLKSLKSNYRAISLEIF